MVEPVWGPQTSYLNFCEEDYIVTRYIAEFINTLSSLAYIVYGIYGLASCDKFPTASRLIPYCGLMGVGICSGGYHMTLKYHTQMFDELSMHLLTTPLLYRLLSYNASPQRTKLVGLALSTLFTTVMITHVVLDEFLLHAISFGLGVLIIARRSIQIISQRTLDLDTRRDLRNISIAGISFFIFGYMVWLIDNWACRYLIDIRHTVGLPFAFLFELHGWWHFFTGIGGYIAVIVVDSITSNEKVDNPTSRLAWPVPLVAQLMASSVVAKPA
ncbi:hypothetical protein FGSG_08281 [Fusarium graminearum PH-1]|uniref:Chromosome 2, complete genome n=2 Tax=Gibberella zeae TaxID=5518 RepID=I1RVK1_GIBZE|nr:hypothetical protein FGSG_08281 [Fusarium graminearum PH-1]ESU15089.1 hypothetical protein FGSG_08281 [Fusarium graminearum PH-1]CAF3458893.1 unnamed protein product [Fusarium graminearum]CEF76579.1 unnamed protein product [Fusarium graminearum]VTO89456.1 unnamed protein product [Fusarium graminearum]|eukprot:XP_011320514.1 hypothetical protein FGSG_08281 [Fusarium graminearum PH-1]